MMRRSCVDHTISGRAVVVLLFLVVVFVTRLQAAPLDVFVAIPPQQWLARQLGGEFVHSQVLLDQGQEPHSYEPSPRQISALFHSRLYCTMGLAFEREIVRKLRLAGGGPLIIDTTHDIKQIPIGGPSLHGTRVGLDPHVWLAPDNLKIMAGNMTEAFCRSDPQHGVDYRHRYNKLVIVLDSLDQAIHTLLDPCHGAAFYVFHPAFGYFAHAYGLRQRAIEVAGKSPGPRRLHSLIQQAVADGAKVIFVQPQFDPRSCRAIARAIGGVVIPLDPLASDVMANLRMMAESIHQALTATGPK